MKTLIKELYCHNCNGSASLQEFENEMYIDRIKNIVKFKMINYECNFCGWCFTTTESDTIVLKRISNSIRCEKRKSKINNIL
jgi:hypothetical protein